MINKIVKYGASWCAPCKAVGSILEKYKDKYEISEIDIEEDTDIATKKGIRSIPYIEFYDNETLVTTKIGSITEEEFLNTCNNDGRN